MTTSALWLSGEFPWPDGRMITTFPVLPGPDVFPPLLWALSPPDGTLATGASDWRTTLSLYVRTLPFSAFTSIETVLFPLCRLMVPVPETDALESMVPAFTEICPTDGFTITS